jgi:hypothetical protein
MTGSGLRAALVLVPLFIAGVAGSVTALSSRNVDDAFLFEQRHPTTLRISDVEQLVAKAPEPVAGSHPPGLRASCRPGPTRGFRNPWRCDVRYRDGQVARFRITIQEDGSYVGDHAGVRRVVVGCCVPVPTAG